MKNNFVMLPMRSVMDYAIAYGFAESVKFLEAKTDIKLVGFGLAVSILKSEGLAHMAEAQKQNIMYAAKHNLDLSGAISIVQGDYCAYLAASNGADECEIQEIESQVNSVTKDAERYRKWVGLIETSPSKVASAIASCIYKEDYDAALDAL